MKGYKTFAVNGAAAIIPIVDLALNNGEILSAVLGSHGAAVVSVLGLVNMGLRWITTTPIFTKEGE